MRVTRTLKNPNRTLTIKTGYEYSRVGPQRQWPKLVAQIELKEGDEELLDVVESVIVNALKTMRVI